MIIENIVLLFGPYSEIVHPAEFGLLAAHVGQDW